MDLQTGRLSTVMAGCACGSMVLVLFFHKKFALGANFLWKRWPLSRLFRKHVALRATCFRKSMSHSTLPEANRAMCPGRRLGWNRPRKSYQLHKHPTEATIRLVRGVLADRSLFLWSGERQITAAAAAAPGLPGLPSPACENGIHPHPG